MVMTLFKRLHVFARRHSSVITGVVFVLAWISGSFLFYARFPQNFAYANFFAEDGQHFVRNIMTGGFFHALVTPFNGYFIFGIYILTGAGFVVNAVLYGGHFVDLPQSLALVSYAFLGLCSALPIVLLRSYMAIPYRIAIAVLISLLPFPSFDYGVFGTIGNLKFAFAFIAVLLVAYRLRLRPQSARIVLIDIALLLAAYTTAGVYLILPYIIASRRGVGLVRSIIRSRSLRPLAHNRSVSLVSGAVLATLCLIQIAFILVNGTPKMPGYLDQPFKWSSVIEVFIARSYLYPVVSAVYTHLGNVVVIILMIALLFLLIFYGRRRNFVFYVMCLTSILTTSLVFVVNRTGTLFFYNHYASSGFDNFFYAQNFIAICLIILVVEDFTQRYFSRFIVRFLFAGLIVTGMALTSIMTSLSYAPNDFMQYTITPLRTQLSRTCSEDKTTDTVTFMVYPFDFLTMTEPRAVACTFGQSPVPHAISTYADLQLTPAKSLPIQPGTNSFHQVFESKDQVISSFAVFLSTYYQPSLSNYRLYVMDATCRVTIRTEDLPAYVHDNAYRSVPINPITNARGRSYCFTIKPTSSTAQPLVLTTVPGSTGSGSLYVNGQMTSDSIVFDTSY